MTKKHLLVQNLEKSKYFSTLSRANQLPLVELTERLVEQHAHNLFPDGTNWVWADRTLGGKPVATVYGTYEAHHSLEDAMDGLPPGFKTIKEYHDMYRDRFVAEFAKELAAKVKELAEKNKQFCPYILIKTNGVELDPKSLEPIIHFTYEYAVRDITPDAARKIISRIEDKYGVNDIGEKEKMSKDPETDVVSKVDQAIAEIKAIAAETENVSTINEMIAEVKAIADETEAEFIKIIEEVKKEAKAEPKQVLNETVAAAVAGAEWGKPLAEQIEAVKAPVKEVLGEKDPAPKKEVILARVTPEFVESRIASVHYFRNGTLTIAVLTHRNGFKAVGTSACVDPESYDEKIGRELARKRAFDKLWEVEGFALCERIGQPVEIEPKKDEPKTDYSNFQFPPHTFKSGSDVEMRHWINIAAAYVDYVLAKPPVRKDEIKKAEPVKEEAKAEPDKAAEPSHEPVKVAEPNKVTEPAPVTASRPRRTTRVFYIDTGFLTGTKAKEYLDRIKQEAIQNGLDQENYENFFLSIADDEGSRIEVFP